MFFKILKKKKDFFAGVIVCLACSLSFFRVWGKERLFQIQSEKHARTGQAQD